MEGKTRFLRDQPQNGQFLAQFWPILLPRGTENDKNHLKPQITPRKQTYTLIDIQIWGYRHLQGELQGHFWTISPKMSNFSPKIPHFASIELTKWTKTAQIIVFWCITTIIYLLLLFLVTQKQIRSFLGKKIAKKWPKLPFFLKNCIFFSPGK